MLFAEIVIYLSKLVESLPNLQVVAAAFNWQPLVSGKTKDWFSKGKTIKRIRGATTTYNLFIKVMVGYI